MYLQENSLAKRFIKMKSNVNNPFFSPVFQNFNVCPLYAEACGENALVDKIQEWTDNDCKHNLVG